MYSKNYVKSPRVTVLQRSLWLWLLTDFCKRMISRCNLCMEVRRERDILARLTDSQLRDIGVNRADADVECRRSYFDVSADRVAFYEELGDGVSRLKF